MHLPLQCLHKRALHLPADPGFFEHDNNFHSEKEEKGCDMDVNTNA